MSKKREEPREWPSACITAVSPSRQLPSLIPHRVVVPLADYFVYSNETDGAVHINPNSPAWFRWLDGLTSFSFSGKDGDFLASKQIPAKPGQPAHWMASQQWEEKEYTRDLGQTANLTTSFLEEVAADMEAEVSEKEIGGTGEGDLIYPFLPAWKEPDKRGWNSIRYQCLLTHQQHSHDEKLSGLEPLQGFITSSWEDEGDQFGPWPERKGPWTKSQA
jgi:hypothetical protein